VRSDTSPDDVGLTFANRGHAEALEKRRDQLLVLIRKVGALVEPFEDD
jgi:hypothetical protein